MSNKNYNKMYNKSSAEAQETVELEVETVVEAPVETPVEAPVEAPAETPVVEVQMAIEEVAEPEVITPVEEPTTSAIVIGCAKLNVREEPSPKACVVAVIDASNEVVIYDTESFGNYYKVCTAAGIEGYCIKDYLELK